MAARASRGRIRRTNFAASGGQTKLTAGIAKEQQRLAARAARVKLGGVGARTAALEADAGADVHDFELHADDPLLSPQQRRMLLRKRRGLGASTGAIRGMADGVVALVRRATALGAPAPTDEERLLPTRTSV